MLTKITEYPPNWFFQGVINGSINFVDEVLEHKADEPVAVVEDWSDPWENSISEEAPKC